MIDLVDQTPKSQITPETYLGQSRRERYSPSKDLSLNNWTLGGSWDTQDEYISSKQNSTLDFKFNAGKVFLVITPATTSDIILC